MCAPKAAVHTLMARRLHWWVSKMTSQQPPSSPSRAKIALAVAWVLAALAISGWSVDGSGDEDRQAAAAIAGAARVAELSGELAVAEDSPVLTLGVIASAAAAIALVLGARVVVSTLAKGHPPTRLAPSHAQVPASSGRVTRRRLPRTETVSAPH
jgi:hypothetical protein